MDAGVLRSLIAERAAHLGLTASPEVVDRFANYLTLLAEWNARMNLTALDVQTPSAEAIHRLLLEPLAAAALVRPTDRVLVDIGSGGGSPALPLAIATPWIRLVMVEARAKKAAFLREALRALAVVGGSVENRRFEDFARLAGREGVADVLTVRGVRLDTRLAKAMARVVAPTGRVVLFRSQEQIASLDRSMRQFREVPGLKVQTGERAWIEVYSRLG